MDKHNRAVRRHHAARLKQKRKYYWGYGAESFRHSGNARDQAPQPPRSMDATVLGKVLHTPQRCSCFACGNQRHNVGGWLPTLQEQRRWQQYREQLEEWVDGWAD